MCNLALSHISQAADVTSIRPPDGTIAADKCFQFFDQARDELLEMHAWKFATARRALVEVTNPVQHWAFAYQLPTDSIRPLAVLLTDSSDDERGYPFAVETNGGVMLLYTNVENAVLKYIWRVTNPGNWSPLFTTAMSWLLAHYIAGPITKKPAVVKMAFDTFISMFKLASGADGAGQNVNAYKNHMPDHMRARGVGFTVPDARILRG